MLKMAARVLCVVALFTGLVVGVETPALAVQAGQFCANAQAGAATTADNGATVQCLFNSNSGRYHWFAVTTATTTTGGTVIIFEPTGPVTMGQRLASCGSPAVVVAGEEAAGPEAEAAAVEPVEAEAEVELAEVEAELVVLAGAGEPAGAVDREEPAGPAARRGRQSRRCHRRGRWRSLAS